MMVMAAFMFSARSPTVFVSLQKGSIMQDSISANDSSNLALVPVYKATFWGCRSWGSSVLVVIDQNLRGWTLLDDRSFALAAAAEAAGREVLLSFSGFDPTANNGEGYFASVWFAFDVDPKTKSP